MESSYKLHVANNRQGITLSRYRYFNGIRKFREENEKYPVVFDAFCKNVKKLIS